MRAPSRSSVPRGPLRPAFDRLEARELLAHGFAARHADARPTAFTDVVYAEGPAGPLELDVHLPAGRAPAGGWPVVVAIHGGGWRRFDKAEYEPEVGATLLDAGFAVVAPDYTLSAPGRPSWPENLDDVREAVRWVKENASEFGFDPDAVAAMGESAGGHLALMLGTDPGPPDASGVTARVDAVVDFFGPTDLASLEQESRSAAPDVVQYLGGTAAQLPASYSDASPVDHVSPSSAPVLIAQGSADTVVPPAQSEELVRALDAAGVPNELVIVSGASHGFGLVADGDDLRPTVIAFLRAWVG